MTGSTELAVCEHRAWQPCGPCPVYRERIVWGILNIDGDYPIPIGSGVGRRCVVREYGGPLATLECHGAPHLHGTRVTIMRDRERKLR